MAKAATKVAETPQPLVAPSKEAPVLIDLNRQAVAHKLSSTGMTIDSVEMFEVAGAVLADIRAAEKRVEEEKDKIAKPLYSAWKNTNALFKPLSDMLDLAKRTVSSKMVAFEDIERAKRIAAEQAALLRQKEEQAAANEKLEAATQALADGTGSIEQFQEAAVDAMVAEVALPMTPVAEQADRGGHARVSRWKAEVTDVPAFLMYLAGQLAAKNERFDNTVEFKLGQLQAYAASSDGAKIPGVTFTKESSITARAR